MLTLDEFFNTYVPEEKQAAMKAVGGSYYKPGHVRFRQCLNAMANQLRRLKTIVAAKKGHHVVVLTDAELARLNYRAGPNGYGYVLRGKTKKTIEGN